MPRLVLKYVEDSQTKHVCIWCDEVPPPRGGGPGRLCIPNVTREYNETGQYEFLKIPRLGYDDAPAGMPPDDIYLTLMHPPGDTYGWQLPYNGIPLGQKDGGQYWVTIKMTDYE